MEQLNKLKIILFDDNQSVRNSIALMLNETSNLDLVGSFENCDNLLYDIESCNPDIILMDISMPVKNGIEAVREIRQNNMDIPIIMQTVFDDDDNVFDAISAGANGYLLKNSSQQKLVESILEVLEGGAPMTPLIARKVLKRLQEDKVEKIEFHLSPREKEVLEWLVKGLPYKQIADKMGITYDTVRAHMKKIYQKLHVASMTEAVAKAIKFKIFSFKN